MAKRYTERIVFNRRFLERELFDQLVKASVSTETITYSELVKTDKPIMN